MQRNTRAKTGKGYTKAHNAAGRDAVVHSASASVPPFGKQMPATKAGQIIAASKHPKKH